MKDYYKILGVSEDAGQQAIKAAFRKLAFKHHPDTNPGNEKEAEARFKEINEAYAVIGDKTKRQQYDAARKSGFTGAGAEGFRYSQQDIFQSIFTNRATLDELNRMFSQAGLRFDDDFLNRVFSSGSGSVFHFYTQPGGSRASHIRTASSAPVHKADFFERMISKAMAKTGRFLLKRLLGVEYTPNLDLHIDFKLTPEDAAAGGEKEVSYQRGKRKKKLMVKIPPAARQGTRIRLKGMGLTEKKKTGDLYLHINIRKQTPLE
ncbi:DnaJ domain-containing protein [Chloroflexota bacterium]